MENKQNQQTKVPITRLNKFFDDQDFDLEVDFGREYMEGDLHMSVVLFSIDIEETDTDDVYKEVGAENVRFYPPVEILVNLTIAEAENATYNPNGTLRYRDFGNLTFNVYQKQLNEKQVDIKYGDYIGYRYTESDMKFWVVVNDGKIHADNEHTIFGYKGAVRTIECAVADPNEFTAI
tara:strand:- start:4606 stop:5139 length:534 start_codon:yes stop_codon:yes gene_type:complete